MVNAGITVIWLLVRQMLYGASWVIMAGTLLVLMNVAIQGFVGINMGVLGDIFALVQIWLPFNLSTVVAWCTLATGAFLAYKTSVIVHNVTRDLTTSPKL